MAQVMCARTSFTAQPPGRPDSVRRSRGTRASSASHSARSVRTVSVSWATVTGAGQSALTSAPFLSVTTTQPQPSRRPPVADRGMSVAQALRREVRMPNSISAGDTAWLLASAALVMLMTPALGFFYGGLVRRKNVLATIMHSFFILCLISVQWVLWGYTLAFGPDKGGIIGGLDWLALKGVGQYPGPYAPTVPHEAFMVFQMMFAVITPALITGAFAERKRFKAFVVFTLLWATFVYDPVAHRVWGGGWLGQLD